MDETIAIDNRLFEFIVDAVDVDQRIDVFLSQNIPEASRSQVQKLIGEGHLLVNKKLCKKSGYRIEQGDCLQFRFTDVVSRALEPQPLDLDILFEDRDLMIVNKPAGLMVHPGAGRSEPTLIEGVMYHLRGQELFAKEEIATGRPGIVHRLDADTSGAMVVAKNSRAHAHLSRQFQEKTNVRIYRAILCGDMVDGDLIVRSYLYRDPRHRTSFASMAEDDYHRLCAERKRKDLPGFKYAESYFKRNEVYQLSASLVSVKLRTGRTHQIRVHAKSLNLPVVGDPVYGGDCAGVKDPRVAVAVSKLQRQMLHAETIGIIHPTSGEKLAFKAPPPNDFVELLAFLRSLDQPVSREKLEK